MISAKLPHIFYGGDYNPEQWPESVWLGDMRLMREAGVNLASIGIFSWAKLEPRPGTYEFGWLDRVMDLLAKNGIFADLATASASPPAWMAKHHPESLPQDADGRRFSPGGRQHYCPNSVVYRKHAGALTRELAARYKNHPALAMWHINNEYACHIPQCMCDVCAREFRIWLKTKYGTLAKLNESWGTAFWSQWYYEWDEILPPRKAPTYCNPSQQLDYLRFMNHSIFSCYLNEAKILREVTPSIPVTTNLMGYFKPLDYFQWAGDMDFVSWDSYPDPADGHSAIVNAAWNQDLMRSLKGGQPFVLMEQTPSQVNWRGVNVLKRPGVMRLWSYQNISRGGDGILFFQWRAAKAGAEKFHGAMVGHVDADKSRVYAEVKQLGNELKKLDAIIDSRVEADVAFMMDWQSWWGLELDSHPSRLSHADHHLWFYRELHDRNIAVDYVRPEAHLTRYKLVIAPVQYMLSEKAADNIHAFVKAGGTFITTYFSGIADENDHIRLGGYPELLKDVLGLWVEEWDPYPQGRGNSIKLLKTKKSSPCSLWTDVLHTTTAKPLAVFEKDFYAGKPALTENRFGKGRAFYFATRTETEFTGDFLATLCKELKIAAPLATPPQVEASVRMKDGKRFLFLLNHSGKAQTVNLAKWKGTDLLTGKAIRSRAKLEANGVLIVEE